MNHIKINTPTQMMLYHSMLDESICQTTPCCISDKILLFDIDDTFYNTTPELTQNIKDENVKCLKDLGIKGDLPKIYKMYDEKYMSIWKGIQINHPKVDHEMFCRFINAKREFFKQIVKDRELIEIMSNIKGYDMYCFTNSPLIQALDVLEYLGINEYIKGIFYPNFTGSMVATCKPEKEAYLDVMEKLGHREIYFFDDIKANIQTGQVLGWKCSLITSDFSIKMALRPFLDVKK